jgi:membrane protease YdiL (CAAX protease family)
VPWIGEASLPVTMLTPTIATLIMLALIAPEGGVRKSLSLLGLDRAGLKAWPLAIAGPAVIHLVGLIILSLAGLAVFAAPQMAGSVGFAIFKILSGLVIGTLFALGEEIGWRGYMLPRLLGRGVVPAMLLVGFLHGIWHLPLMLSTDYYHNTGNPLLVVPLFLITLTLAGVFFGFLRLWTGSVWAVAIAHAAANMAWEIMSEMTQTQTPLVLEYVGGESGVIMITGLLVFGFFIIRYMRSDRFKLAPEI